MVALRPLTGFRNLSLRKLKGVHQIEMVNPAITLGNPIADVLLNNDIESLFVEDRRTQHQKVTV